MVKIKRKSKIKLSLLLFCCCALVIVFILRANAILKPQLEALALQKTNDAISTLVQRVLSKLEYDVDDLIIYDYDDKGSLVSIQYNTRVINEVLNHALESVNESLEAASIGKEDPILKEVFFEDGIIYDVPAGYLTGITFLQNYGYRFHISMRLLHYVNGDLEVISKPYGINNSLITINLHLTIEAEAITAVATQKITFKEVLPIVVQVVHGEVPSYTGFVNQ